MCTSKTKICTSEDLLQLWNLSPLQSTLWLHVVVMFDGCMLLASCSNTIAWFWNRCRTKQEICYSKNIFLACQGFVIVQTKTADSSKIVWAGFIFFILHLLSLGKNRRWQIKEHNGNLLLILLFLTFFLTFSSVKTVVCTAWTTSAAEEFLWR